MAKSCHVAGVFFLLLAVTVAGCGGAAGFRQGAPTERERAYAARVEAVKRAAASFRAAEAVGGEYSDPYSYYMAKEYLDLAEHELKSGDIRGVIAFAEKSESHSAALIRQAGGVAK